MLAPHGWKSRPSQRRGFTVVQAQQESHPPVVVSLDDPRTALHLFRSALDEAMSRSVGLVVLDYGEVSLHDQLWEPAPTELEEHRILKGMLTNPHVRVIRVENSESQLETTVSYCESNRATLLIVSADLLADAGAQPALSSRIFSGRFDLLVVTNHDEDVELSDYRRANPRHD